MNLDFFNRIEDAIERTIDKKDSSNELNIENITKETISNENMTVEEIELANKLDAIEEFTIDRFEEDIVVLEDRKTGNMININKEEIPEKAKEGDILKRINGKYILDENRTQEVEDRIKRKMDDLWN